MKKKHYFITYQAVNRQGSKSIWNQVINTTPMVFIKAVEEAEVSGTYYNFVVINTCEITKEDYDKFKDRF
jgi:hypothetical protein